jgi:hypothetical protein
MPNTWPSYLTFCLGKHHIKMFIWYTDDRIQIYKSEVSVHLAEGFQRRRLKCEKLTYDRWLKLTLHLARWAKNNCSIEKKDSNRKCKYYLYHWNIKNVQRKFSTTCICSTSVLWFTDLNSIIGISYEHFYVMLSQAKSQIWWPGIWHRNMHIFSHHLASVVC